MPNAKQTSEEVAARGEAIYSEKIRSDVEQDNKGKYLVLDVDTGDYAIADDDLAATKQMLAKRPDAILYGLRIGYPAPYRLGGFAKVHEG